MILVDDLFDYGKKGVWCHLAVEPDDDLTILHDFAKKIGLKRDWFQNRPNLPHYDLSPAKRQRAINYGAEPVSRKELFIRCTRDANWRDKFKESQT